MTTEEFITTSTSGVLSLVREDPTIKDESTLVANEYFALMVYTFNQSYLRNYEEYEGVFNLNPKYKTYDIGIEKSRYNKLYIISKYYQDIFEPDKGRIIIVNTTDLTKCVII